MRLPALALIVILALLVAAGDTSRVAGAPPHAAPLPDTPVGAQLAWALGALNGGAAELTEADVIAHVSPALLAALPPALLVDTFRQLSALGPYAFEGLTRPPTATQAIALLTDASGSPFVVPIAVEPIAPARISGLAFAPAPVPAGVTLQPFVPGAEPDRFDGLVDLGGRQLYLSCQGSGRPTVVLESGLSDAAAPWFAVERAVAGFTRVCTYDRANTVAGASDPAPTPRSGHDAAADLAALLAAAGVPGPYVLVGHSIGSHVVRLYAAEHPEAVSGLVLVDAAHEEQDRRRQLLVSPALFAELQRVLSLNAEGIDLDATAAEVRAARAALPLPPLPLVVLTAGVPDPAQFPPGWPMAAEARLRAELQADLVGLVPGGRQMIAAQSQHYIHQSEPGLVVEAIRQAVEATRR